MLYFLNGLQYCALGCNTTDLTLVIMGALFDLRSAPPPAPPAAPAHWSTSIRSIPWSAGPAVAAPVAGLRPFNCGVGLYSSPVEARPAGLTSGKPSRRVSGLNTEAARSLPHFPPKTKALIRVWLRVWSTFVIPQLRFTRRCLQRKFNGCVKAS